MLYILINKISDPIVLTFIVITIIILFIIPEGYLGKPLHQLFNNFFNPIYFELYVSIVSILLLFIYIWYINSDIVYCIDDETTKQLIDVKGNNINIHNPNINIPGSLAKAVTGVGIGGAIAGGMTAVSHFAKSSSMPLGAKVGTTLAGGMIAGGLFVATNAMNTITQNNIENKNSRSSSSSGNGSFPASSALENNEVSSTTIDSITDLLNSNLILNICMLYLLIALAVLYISTKVANKNLNLTFFKNIFGQRFHYLLIKLLSFTSKSNEIWMIIIWILLIIACAGTTFIAHFMIVYIDVISEIYQQYLENNK